jgi:hypothetical protein
MNAMSGAWSRIVCRDRRRMLLPIFAWALLTACASSGAGYHDEALERPSTLTVENHSWAPVTVYIARDGVPWRLGDVEASSGRSFSLSSFGFTTDGRDVYLVARPLAGSSFRSEEFAFMQGRTTVWTIENASSLSTVVMR